MKLRILILIGIAVVTTAHAQVVEDPLLLLKEGNHLYEQGDYKAAAQKYERIIFLGYESGALYYNLGNSYFRLNDIGNSILYYERAKKLLPEDEAVQFNLELANLLAVDRIVAPPQFFLANYFTALKNLFTINQLCWLVIVLYGALMVVLIVRVFIGNIKVRTVSTIALTCVIVPFLLFSLVLGARVHEKHNKIEGIIMAEQVGVKSEPSQTSAEQFYLHVGAKVRIEGESGEWLRIRLADGKTGWLIKDTLEII